MTNNKVRLFPIPVNETTQSLYFDYLVRGDRDSVTSTVFSGSQDVVSDFSIATYYNISIIQSMMLVNNGLENMD